MLFNQNLQLAQGSYNWGVVYNTLDTTGLLYLNRDSANFSYSYLKINGDFRGEVDISADAQFGTSGTTGIVINPRSAMTFGVVRYAGNTSNFVGNITSNNSGLVWYPAPWTGQGNSTSLSVGNLTNVPVSPNQLINNFQLPSNLNSGDLVFNAPSSTSKLPVNLTLTNGNAVLTGTAGGQYVITRVGTDGGVLQITANQPGNSTYNAASPVTYTTYLSPSGVNDWLITGLSDGLWGVLYNTGSSQATVNFVASQNGGFQANTFINGTNYIGSHAGQFTLNPDCILIVSASGQVGSTSVSNGFLYTSNSNIQYIDPSHIITYNTSSVVTTSFKTLYTNSTNSSYVQCVINPFSVYNTVAGASFTIPSPTATSGLRATLDVQSGPATISYNGDNTYTVNTTAAGTVTLVANQTGSGNYIYAANPLTETFFVAPSSNNVGCGVIDVSAGDQHGLALFQNGTITGWGNNSYGQALGGLLLTGVTGISAGYYHSLALLNNGRVTGWGKDNYGQSSLTNRITGAIKVSAGYDYSLVLLKNGFVVGFGDNTRGAALGGNGITGKC